ncbi:acyl-CoA thioesterase [Dietzia sp.]|uniref:acyl-CoA thioesterase n=1 Tax=Dietzia sp. TaxID=1871616 RepID=UPI002FDA1555
MPSLRDVTSIERIDRDIFRGARLESKLLRTYGGQIACQSLTAAVRTVEEDRFVHSLHGYFLRAGNPASHTVFEVERLRDGRSFSTRRVNAIQEGEVIFSMSASFHVHGQTGLEHADTMPEVVGPDNLQNIRDLEIEAPFNAFFLEWEDWDIRFIPAEEQKLSPSLASQQRVWFRYTGEISDDPNDHVCALAYMSDMTLLGSARVAHPGVEVQEASLDHAMWFQRPFRADEWLLYDQSSPSATGSRSLTQGRIFDASGNLVAAVCQEGLTRTRG